MQVFDDEFDSREMDNWADLINEACYHFAVAMGYMAFLNTPTYVSGGGGASNNDLPKSVMTWRKKSPAPVVVPPQPAPR